MRLSRELSVGALLWKERQRCAKRRGSAGREDSYLRKDTQGRKIGARNLKFLLTFFFRGGGGRKIEF